MDSRQPQKSVPSTRAAQRPLKRMAVGVDEPRQAEHLGHRRILSAWLHERFRLHWR